MYSNQDLIRISKNIATRVEDELLRVGIFNRIFYRSKNQDSIDIKMKNKEYDGCKSFLRDMIGLRINLYFVDDLEISYNFFKKHFDFVEETIDKNEETEFKPTRLNLIFKIPNEYKREFSDITKDNRIDSTFELQLRTVLSEGWHEVDHDLRYKAKDDWDNHEDLGRMFNGILASLEASDWAILQLFQNLAHRHYKGGNLESMLRSKMRIRIEKSELKPDIQNIFKKDKSLFRKLYKIEREEILSALLNKNLIMPLNINNILYMMNYYYLKNDLLLSLTPSTLKTEFERYS